MQIAQVWMLDTQGPAVSCCIVAWSKTTGCSWPYAYFKAVHGGGSCGNEDDSLVMESDQVLCGSSGPLLKV